LKIHRSEYSLIYSVEIQKKQRSYFMNNVFRNHVVQDGFRFPGRSQWWEVSFMSEATEFLAENNLTRKDISHSYRDMPVVQKQNNG
jgi:hypothetical protein